MKDHVVREEKKKRRGLEGSSQVKSKRHIPFKDINTIYAYAKKTD